MNKPVRQLVVGIDETDSVAVRFIEYLTQPADSATRARQFCEVSSEDGTRVWEGTICYGANKGYTVAVRLILGPASLLGKTDFSVRSSHWVGHGFILGRRALKRCKELALDRAQVVSGRILVLSNKLDETMLRCVANELTARLTRPDPTYPQIERRHRVRRNPRGVTRNGFALVAADCAQLNSVSPAPTIRELASVAS